MELEVFGGFVCDLVFNDQQVQVRPRICLTTRVRAEYHDPRRAACRGCSAMGSIKNGLLSQHEIILAVQSGGT